MSYYKVIQLAKKFAASTLDAKYQAQREMLETFTHGFLSDFAGLLNKMESDLFVLKEQKLNKFAWKELGHFWKDLVKIYKEYDKKKPYVGAQKLVHFVRSKMPWIKEMQLTIQDHLENNPVPFTPMSGFQSAQINSLEELIELSQYVEQEMKQNPLIQESLIPSIYPTGLSVINDGADFGHVNPEAPTKADLPTK